LAAPSEAFDRIIDVMKLRVAVGMLAPFAGLGVGLQAEAEIFEQAADQVGTGAISLLGQRGGQMALAAAYPQSAACGSPRVADATSRSSVWRRPGCLTVAALRPPPLRRVRP
jgi:hypothetical protein